MRASRRHMLCWLGLWAGAAVSGCGESGDGRRPEERAASYDPDLDCTDTGGLWPAEAKTRTDNEYRERSDQSGKACFNCTNFIRPAVEGGCGTCDTVKGPINPLGWCTAWTEARS